jgi:hypothetical protein
MYIEHPIRHVQQLGAMGCWSAVVAMINNGRCQLPAELQGRDNTTRSGLSPRQVQALATANGLRYFFPQSWPLSNLLRLLTRRPLGMFGRLVAVQGPSGATQYARHAFAITGAEGDGSDNSTYLHIHDPAFGSDQDGAEVAILYADLLRRFPVATEYLLHRQ